MFQKWNERATNAGSMDTLHQSVRTRGKEKGREIVKRVRVKEDCCGGGKEGRLGGLEEGKGKSSPPSQSQTVSGRPAAVTQLGGRGYYTPRGLWQALAAGEQPPEGRMLVLDGPLLGDFQAEVGGACGDSSENEAPPVLK